MSKFTGRIVVIDEDGEEDIIPMYDADIKEEKIIEISMEKFKNDCPCVLERRNCELAVAEMLIKQFDNMIKEEAMKVITEFVDNKVVDMIYE